MGAEPLVVCSMLIPAPESPPVEPSDLPRRNGWRFSGRQVDPPQIARRAWPAMRASVAWVRLAGGASQGHCRPWVKEGVRIGLGSSRHGPAPPPSPSSSLAQDCRALRRFLERGGFVWLLETRGIWINSCIKPLL